MMYFSAIALTGLLAFFTQTNADVIQEDLSFGAHGSVWSEDHREVTGFNLDGENNHVPELLSDRIIMTPPWPGHIKSSLWADHPEPNEDWMVELDFKATGPDYAGGSLNLWYVHDKSEIGYQDIYNVTKFEGLGVVIDRNGKQKSGSIRAFKNDRSKAYKGRHDIDRQAFAECDFSYRNLRDFTKVQIHQKPGNFRILINEKECFTSNTVHIPRNYFMGLTANSDEYADSFEVKSFVVKFPGHKLPHGQGDSHPESHHQKSATGWDEYKDDDWTWTEKNDHIKDKDASHFTTEAERFQDIHDRVTLLNHQMDMLYHDFSEIRESMDKKHQEMLLWLAPIHDHASQSKQMLEALEQTLVILQKDLDIHDISGAIDNVRHLIGDSHMALLTHLPSSIHSIAHAASPQLGWFFFLVVVSQLMVGASYLAYKRRLKSQPKKYL